MLVVSAGQLFLDGDELLAGPPLVIGWPDGLPGLYIDSVIRVF